MSTSVDPSEMPFLKHLEELRSVLIQAAIGIAAGTSVCLMFSDQLVMFLTEPLRAQFSSGGELIGTGPAEAFMVKLKTAVACGVVLSSPYSFFQLWRFISPGLLEEEKKFTGPFVAATTGCFLLGILFCIEVVFPFAFQFFLSEFASINLTPSIRIGEYLSFAVTMALVFGLIFELPVVSYFLARIGILTSAWMKSTLRYAIVIIFIISAVLTPPDVVSQTLLAIPLLVLYGISILVVGSVEKRIQGKKSTANAAVPSTTPASTDLSV